MRSTRTKKRNENLQRVYQTGVDPVQFSVARFSVTIRGRCREYPPFGREQYPNRGQSMPFLR